MKRKNFIMMFCISITVSIVLCAALYMRAYTATSFNFEDFSYFPNEDGYTATLYKYIGKDVRNQFVIPSKVYDEKGKAYTVTEIMSYSFEGNLMVVSVILPGTLKSIGNDAFKNCRKLSEIYIPDSVEYIGGGAFENCTSLTYINIPRSIVEISSWGAFRGCTNLRDVYIPEGITSIGGFADCTGLTTIQLPSSTTSIEVDAFYGCTRLALINIPNKVTNIGAFAFSECNLTEVNIPNSVTNIGEYAFSDCSSLKKVRLPGSLTSIGEYLFSGCDNLSNVFMANGITYISDGMFYDCRSLKELDIPNSVTNIGAAAFESCSGLTKLNIPNSVTNIGAYAFGNCSGLTKLDIPNNVTNIGDGMFSGCSSLIEVNIPNNVTSIGDYAFYGCINLTKVEIPENVNKLGGRAFYCCDNLDSVYFYGNVPELWGDRVFHNKQTIYYEFGKTGWTTPIYTDWDGTEYWLSPDNTSYYKTVPFSLCDHFYTKAYPAKSSTCIELGHNKYYICDDCGAVLKEDQETLTTIEDETLTEYGPHRGGIATCDDRAICDLCLKEYGGFTAHEVVFYEKIEPTHSKKGFDSHYRCNHCGGYFNDLAEILTFEELIIPELGCYGGIASCTELAICSECGESYGEYLEHEYNMNTWTYNSEGHWHKCVNCDSHTEVEVHIPGPEATEEAPQVCTVCGYVIKDIRFTLGDISDDGKIDLDDVVTLLRHVSKASVITDPRIISACDVDGNGVVNLDDVVRLLRFVSKAIPSLR